MLLIVVGTARLRAVLGMMAVSWGYVVKLVATCPQAVALVESGAPICAAILEPGLPGVVAIAQRLARAEPFAPPVLLVGDGPVTPEGLEVPFVRSPQAHDIVRIWLVEEEPQATRCALAHHGKRLGLSARETELLAYEGTGFHGAELQTAMRCAASTLSEMRRRMRPKLGGTVDEAVALATALFKAAS